VGLLLLESLRLWLSGWTCPSPARRAPGRAARRRDGHFCEVGADRIFPVCGTLYVVAIAAILWRVLG